MVGAVLAGCINGPLGALPTGRRVCARTAGHGEGLKVLNPYYIHVLYVGELN